MNMRRLALFLTVGLVAAHSHVTSAASPKTQMEYINEPMPAGFQVINTEFEGPVFADAQGHTMYRWPIVEQRNGSVGDTGEKISNCLSTPIRVTSGYTTVYPVGELLPEADKRLSCTQYWPPVVAPADARPIGAFDIIKRSDGTQQWAYKGFALYTSHLDHLPGDTNGGRIRRGRDPYAPVYRQPVGPSPAVPPQFRVANMELGLMLTLTNRYSVYTYDKDTGGRSNCNDSCLADWKPVPAPEFAVQQGAWSVIVRTGGAKQWAYRGKPLYTRVLDVKRMSYEGGDVPGWRNVFMQFSPPAPKGFGLADTFGGQVRTAPNGKAIYVYFCTEDSLDAIACDTPSSPQVYRWAMCGGGDPDRCVKTFPYVLAEKSAKSETQSWGIRDIDSKTGRYVAAGTPGSLHIWTFRDRPIYTFAGDNNPGDIGGDGWGMDHGQTNGFSAIWVRDDYENLDTGTWDGRQ